MKINLSPLYGNGAHRYELVPDWAQPESTDSFVDVVGLSVDAQDRIYVFNRSSHPVIVLDSSGRQLSCWGEGRFGRPHGSCLAPDGCIYCTDDYRHMVYRFTTGGEQLMALGQPDQPSDTGHRPGFDIFERVASIERAGPPFNQPTGVAVSCTGAIFVSDGYGNARVHRFNASGEHLLSWGEPGGCPGQFRLPHNLWVDHEDRVWVADRENHRIQIFTAEGAFLDQWTDVMRPTHIFMDADGMVYVSELVRRISIFSPDGTLVARWGNEHHSVDHPLLYGPHVMVTDSRGDLYVGEVAQSYGKVDRGTNTLQKFARVG